MKIVTFAAIAAIVTLSALARADGERSEAAGNILLESFRCESMGGSAVQSVRTSLANLKTSLDSISEKEKDCQAQLAAIGRLPELDSILSQMDSYGAIEELRKADALIEEMLRDLAVVKRMAPDDPNRALYPDETTLQSMVAEARVQLLRLRVSNKVETAAKDRKKYIDGVRQLDNLAIELSSSLRKNTECYKKHPVLRRQIMTGLIGISGFFAQSPAGIGITLAGRVLQNIFDIQDSSNSSRTSDFEASNQTMLVSGISCTLETLGNQHCRLIRQEALLGQLANKPCADGKCSPEMKKLLSLMEKGKSANAAVSEITKNLGSRGDNTTDQAEVMQVNSSFLSSASSFEATLSDLKDKLKASETSTSAESKKADIRNSLAAATLSFSGKVFGPTQSDVVMSDDQPIKQIQQKMSDAEKERHFLNFVYDEGEYDAAIQKVASSINSNPMLRKKYKVESESGNVGIVKVTDAARTVLFKAFFGSIEKDIPEAKRLNESMATIAFNDKIKSRLEMYKSSILQQFRFLPKDEQIANFTVAFLTDDAGQASTLKHLENINAFFDSIPEDFVNTRGKLLKLGPLQKEIQDIITLGKEIETATADIPEDKMKALYSKVTVLLDHTKGFKEKMATITQAVGNHQAQKLANNSANKQDMNDLVFMQYNDFVEGIYDLKKPYERQMDTKAAIALSGTQIEAFGNFFSLYQDKAVNLLNRSNANGKNFNSGLAENISQSLKDHFCVQTLVLTEIPTDLKNKECANAAIRQGSSELRFADFAGLPHKERVCAYRNFLNKIDASSAKRSSSSSPNLTK